MGTSVETDAALAQLMFADDLVAEPSGETDCSFRLSCWYLPQHSKTMFGAAGGPAWPPGDSSFVSTPTWASLQQEQAGQHNFEQLLQTNLDMLPDFPEFDATLALPEAGRNGSREAASKADSDVKPSFKTSTRTRDSNRKAQQVPRLLSCRLHLAAWQPLSLENQHIAAGALIVLTLTTLASCLSHLPSVCRCCLGWLPELAAVPVVAGSQVACILKSSQLAVSRSRTASLVLLLAAEVAGEAEGEAAGDGGPPAAAHAAAAECDG